MTDAQVALLVAALTKDSSALPVTRNADMYLTWLRRNAPIPGGMRDPEPPPDNPWPGHVDYDDPRDHPTSPRDDPQ